MRKKLSAALAMLCILLPVLAGCQTKTQTVMKTEVKTDDYILEHYVQNLDTVMDNTYERTYPTEVRNGVEVGGAGPSDPTYYGIIHITEKEGKELMEKYEWTLNDSELPDMQQIVYDVHADWYASEEFSKDTFKLVIVDAAFFDGKNTIIYKIRRI